MKSALQRAWFRIWMTAAMLAIPVLVPVVAAAEIITLLAIEAGRIIADQWYTLRAEDWRGTYRDMVEQIKRGGRE